MTESAAASRNEIGTDERSPPAMVPGMTADINLKLQCARPTLPRMSDQQLRKEAHDLDVTVWVGKSGVDAVVDELADQLDDRRLVKVKFLRAARGGTTTDELAAELADAVNADLVETRGNTAVLH